MELPTWCKVVKKELISRDMSIEDLANKIGRSREYTTAVVNGRQISSTIRNEISDFLNISNNYAESDFTKEWRKEVKLKLVEKNLTVPEFAKEIGMSRQYVNSLITGKTYSPAAMMKISDFLEIKETPTC